MTMITLLQIAFLLVIMWSFHIGLVTKRRWVLLVSFVTMVAGAAALSHTC